MARKLRIVRRQRTPVKPAEDLKLGDILQKLSHVSPAHLKAMDVIARDVWQRKKASGDK